MDTHTTRRPWQDWLLALLIFILALAVYNDWNNLKTAFVFILLASLLMQGYSIFWCQQFKDKSDTYRMQLKEAHPLLFLILMISLNIIIAQLDPSWQRLKDYVYLPSGMDVFLQKIIPVIFAGITGLWFGMLTLALLALAALWQAKFEKKSSLRAISFFLPFFLPFFYVLKDLFVEVRGHTAIPPFKSSFPVDYLPLMRFLATTKRIISLVPS